MRAPGWEMLLPRYVAESGPFAWGSNDCALWAAKWVRLCTGQDFTADWEGRYTTAAGAARRMLDLGYANVAEIASAALPEKPVAMAVRGDLLLHPSGALGICTGLQGSFLSADGLIADRTLDCERAWGVG